MSARPHRALPLGLRPGRHLRRQPPGVVAHRPRGKVIRIIGNVTEAEADSARGDGHPGVGTGQRAGWMPEASIHERPPVSFLAAGMIGQPDAVA